MADSRELTLANLKIYLSLLANEKKTLRALIDSEMTLPEYKLQAKTRMLDSGDQMSLASAEIARLEAQ